MWQSCGIEFVNYSGTLDGDRACTAELPLPGYAFSLLRAANRTDQPMAPMQPFACCPPYCTASISGAGRAQLHMRLTSYFEISLHAPLPEHANTAAGTCVALGAGSARFPLLGRMPGWDAQSFGWHSDDGKRFHRSGVGQTFGPAYGVGDTVGCGIDFSDTLPRTAGMPAQLCHGKVFYTLNGRFVGYAFSGVDVSEPQWPLVGVDTPHPVSVNFGTDEQVQPLKFDIHAFEAQLWAGLQRGRRRAASAADLGCSGKQPVPGSTSVEQVVQCVRASLASRRRLCLAMRSSACRGALHDRVKAAAAAAGALNRDIGALRTPVLFPVPGSDNPSRSIAAHAKQWRLVDSEPVPMSDLLLSWMLRNLRRQREEQPLPPPTPHSASGAAAGVASAAVAAPINVTQDILGASPDTPSVAVEDWDACMAHAIRALAVELAAGQTLPLAAGATLVLRSRTRTPRPQVALDNAALSPSDTLDSEHSWWSDGSEHVELLDGGHISILSGAPAPHGAQQHARHSTSGVTAPDAAHSPLAAPTITAPAQLGLAHLQLRGAAAAHAQPREHARHSRAAEHAGSAGTLLSPRSLSLALRGPTRCSFE